MIDIEAFTAPAFLVAVSPQGLPGEPRLNAAGRGLPALTRRLVEGVEARALLAALLRSCAATCTARDVALAMPSPDGSGAWRATLVPMTGPDGRVAALLGVCREADAGANPRAPAGDRLSLALQAIHGAEWRYDVRSGTYQGSDEIATLIGEASPRPVSWAEWLERVHPEDLSSFLGRPAPDGSAEFRFRGAHGDLRWARCSRVAFADEAGGAEAVLGIMVDITQERVRETAWAELATHDPLTGLLNRRGLRQEIDRLRAEPSGTSRLALFAVDLDHFKATNDRHGHAAGDAVLVEASLRLGAGSAGAVCARLGGDEFIAVLPVRDEAEAAGVRDRLAQGFRRPLAYRGRWLSVAASVGVSCLSPEDDVALLMDAADADLYARKHARAETPAVAA